MVGTTFQHYRVLALLGRGGMGEVYLAEDTKLGRRVAVKVLPLAAVDEAEPRARLEREARILASLNNPHIVTVHAVETVGDRHCIVMELVEGEPLDRLIADGLPLPPLLRIAIGIAGALAAAHERSIIHRDLKPSNVMVTASHHAKVLDFGLATLRPPDASDATRTALTEAGTVVGTLPYMSPEQLNGKPIDARSDVFSFGVMLHEMAVGRRPFAGESPPAIVSAILRDSPGWVDQIRPGMPHALARLIRRCLEKDPDRRYQSVKDIRNELEDIQREAEVVPPAAAQPGEAGTRRGVPKVFLAAALVAVTAVAIFFGRPVLDAIRTTGGGPAPAIQSLAVLPFQLQVGNAEEEYLVDGMHDALITDLSKISALRVISRSSTLRYRGSGRLVPEIARELGVDAVVEGSVLLAGGRVRVSAQLISGTTDANLWAESYDRDLDDVLVLLNDVARAIAREIRVVVTRDEARRLANVPAASPEVQQAYLRARFFANRLTAPDIVKARELQQTVVDLDQAFAPARAGLAEAELLTAFFDVGPRETFMPAAEENARKAATLDGSLSLAHGVLGLVQLYHHWNWSEAEKEFRLALELNPNDSLSRHGFADYYVVVGNAVESLRQVELGRQSDPFSPAALLPIVGHLEFAGLNARAVQEARQIVELFPENRLALVALAGALWHTQSYDESLDVLARVPGPTGLVSALREGLERGGPREAARAAATYLSAPTPPRTGPLEISRYFAAAGDADAALQWLQRAVTARVPQIVHLRAMVDFDGLRSDPRFIDIVKQIGFPE